MKAFDLKSTQTLKLIPREVFVNADVEITDEFTKESTSIAITGTHLNGFFTTTFNFQPKDKRTYKIIVSSNGKIQWKGKAYAEAGNTQTILLIGNKGLIINTNQGLIL